MPTIVIEIEDSKGVVIRRKAVFFSEKPSRTKQSFRDECDINSVMSKYEKTGLIPVPNSRGQPQYGDFSNVPDYQSALDVVVYAQTLFDRLPARVRDRFHNDPSLFLDFASDEANHGEMVKMGLKKPVAVKPESAVADSDKPASTPDKAVKDKGASAP